MNLTRWDPFGDVDTLFDRLLPRSIALWPSTVTNGDGGTSPQWSPSADISETDQEYLIRAQLPAVKKEDVKVTVDSGVITIQGERKQHKEEKSEKFHRVESLYGSFTRRFTLPDHINVDAIRCEDSDGVLTVHIPKSPAKANPPKQIVVE